MTNKEAANVLRIMASGVELKRYTELWISSFKEAYEMAIKVLEEEPQGDLISRSDLKQMLPAPIEDEYKRVHQIIDNAPSVEAIPNEEGYEMYGKGYLQGYERGKRERPQGRWEYNQYDANPNIGNWDCSECRHIVSCKYNQKPGYNFCPRCGANMREGTE